MNLALKSMKDTLFFIRNYPVAIVFASFFSLATFLISYLPAIANINSGLQVSQSQVMPTLSLGILVLGLTAIILSLVFSLIQFGGFPILVSGCLKKEKNILANAFKKSFRRIISIFASMLATGFITFLPLVPVLIFGLSFVLPVIGNLGSPSSLLELLVLPEFAIVSVALVIGLIVSFYFSARFWLVYPIVMIENRKAVDSIKRSWKISRGNVLPIWFALILLMALIFLPSLAIGFLVGLASIGVVTILWSIVFSVYATTLSGVLTTIFYFNLKKKLK